SSPLFPYTTLFRSHGRFCVICLVCYISLVARWLSCLHCLHCSLTARRSWVRFPHGALLALVGRSSPECTVLRWAISWAFLCGVCMFFPCSQGVSSTKNPNRKTCKKNRTVLSVP